ncbi:hypothetical protein AAG906_022707 [Vitis piasezkii]
MTQEMCLPALGLVQATTEGANQFGKDMVGTILNLHMDHMDHSKPYTWSGGQWPLEATLLILWRQGGTTLLRRPGV